MKKLFFILCGVLPLCLSLLLAGCAGTRSATVPEAPAEAMEAAEALPELPAGPAPVDLSAPGTTPEGVSRRGSVVTVSAAGSYELSGELDGKVVVDADGPVELILNGVRLMGQSCLDIRSNDPVTLVAPAGTVNLFTDTPPAPPSGEASSSEPGSPEPETDEDALDAEEDDELLTAADSAFGAVITSKAALTVTGEGSVTVDARVNNGVRAKDGLTVEGCILTVRSANHGVKAKGGITLAGGSVTVTAGGDALAAEAGRIVPGGVSLLDGTVTLTAKGRGVDAEGPVAVSGGVLTVTSQDDGLRADTAVISGGQITLDAGCDGIQTGTLLSVSGGTLSITTGGGGGDAISHAGDAFGPMMWSSSATEPENSAKGLKSDGDIAISGGVIDLNTADDSIHCAAVCTVDGGEITVLSSDDAIHADDMLVINDGLIRIDDCFEGLEAFAVELRGGDVVIRAVNDGINANGQEMMFRRSTDAEESVVTSASGSATTYVLIAGGSLDLVVTGNSSNMGDGVDSNGAVYITGGDVVVSTFGTFMENGLDTGWGGPVVTGGRVIAGGSSTMAEGFGSSSTQCAAVVSTSYMPDGTEVVLSDEDGNVLWSVVLADAFSCIQISHPDMQVGHVYTLTYGSESTTLDFTDSNLVSQTRGFGFGRPF